MTDLETAQQRIMDLEAQLASKEAQLSLALQMWAKTDELRRLVNKPKEPEKPKFKIFSQQADPKIVVKQEATDEQMQALSKGKRSPEEGTGSKTKDGQ